MSTELTFVLVTGDKCAACHRFLSYTWDLLREKIEQDGRYSIVHITSPMEKNRPNNLVSTAWYHPDLVKYIRFFPSFYLFHNSRWFSEEPLDVKQGNIYGVDEKLDVLPRFSQNIESIWNWIQESSLLLTPKKIKSDSKRFYDLDAKVLRSLEDVIL